MMMKNIHIRGHQASFLGQIFYCCYGKQGFTPSKVEGDFKTPLGTFPVREVFYRADRLEKPLTSLPCTALREDMGWCDDPDQTAYNTRVSLPFQGSHELLYREDALYDLILVMGYNDDPILSGKGSAVFMHLMHPDKEGTQGCVSFQKKDLLNIVEKTTINTNIIIK